METASRNLWKKREGSMKGLDTPILIGLLTGDTRVRSLVASLEGEELATTAINLFELETIARTGPPRGREKRLAAVERLRRTLTILDVGSEAARIAAVRASSGDHGVVASNWLVLGALEAAGCAEWFTTTEASFPTHHEGRSREPVSKSKPKIALLRM
ncbi:MAG: type II toxin-antitoxin system VapC family toxin [Thermoplasmata archaeon]|nr:type II toxin-antitoxin system VapC family toxin [Thermoplasmata archaeon]